MKKPIKRIHVRLLGRPYGRGSAPGRLIHAQYVDDNGSPYTPNLTVCGREPRENSDGFMVVRTNVPTCKRCLKRTAK